VQVVAQVAVVAVQVLTVLDKRLAVQAQAAKEITAVILAHHLVLVFVQAVVAVAPMVVVETLQDKPQVTVAQDLHGLMVLFTQVAAVAVIPIILHMAVAQTNQAEAEVLAAVVVVVQEQVVLLEQVTKAVAVAAAVITHHLSIQVVTVVQAL
jgi:hypothetical protein